MIQSQIIPALTMEAMTGRKKMVDNACPLHCLRVLEIRLERIKERSRMAGRIRKTYERVIGIDLWNPLDLNTFMYLAAPTHEPVCSRMFTFRKESQTARMRG
jgi:hypothetical protein